MNRRTLLITCIVSLVLNVGFIGYLVGRAFFSDSRMGSHFMRSPTHVERLIDSLDSDRVAEMKEIEAKFRSSLHGNYEEIRNAQQRVYRAMLADPFDSNQLTTAQANYNIHFLATKELHDRVWLELAKQLTLEERQHILKTAMPRRYRDNAGSQQKRIKPHQETDPT